MRFGTLVDTNKRNILANNLAAVRQRIDAACANAGRDANEVVLVGVSKTIPAEDIEAAFSLGVRHFGENYLDEALQKVQLLGSTGERALGTPNDRPEWHFIGRIQSNKTRQIAAHFDWVHTVEREKIARRLSEQCPANKLINVLLQINIDNAPAKAGVGAADAPMLLDAICGLPNLAPRGLMTILARSESTANARASYGLMAQLAAELGDRLPATKRDAWDTLSMGMTGDLEAAIDAGATHVRIGTALFGARD